ncbi:17602_t:CDS:2 [Gigaspora margarita]|uniref:17602_t:CDS:1 n=1 Tax=Gigaspora margarita TaxID=4874 RepID=A0ABM8VYK0_GIGMA|nr:17602_t:CDS:2 [Gigaspora margarita]
MIGKKRTRLNINHLTNIASELKFSKVKYNNNNKNEDEDKDENSFDIDNKKDESNLNDLLISEMINLNSYNINETKNTLPLVNDIQHESEPEENSDIDFESIYNEEFY